MSRYNKSHPNRSKCPISCALDIFGDKWTLLVIRDLMFFGRHEYKEMLAAGEGISSNILSDRLKHLLDSEIINVIPHPKSGTRKLYFLTEKGKDLIEIMIHIVRWSNEYLQEFVDIPQEQKELIVNNPDLMASYALKEIENWEVEYGIK